ncbi:hypothetical protein FGB62_75g08 [Gracilaria domingensis]|nr:hypothetical protein FGB62_75g08 [Gracilaria domingensis]
MQDRTSCRAECHPTAGSLHHTARRRAEPWRRHARTMAAAGAGAQGASASPRLPARERAGARRRARARPSATPARDRRAAPLRKPHCTEHLAARRRRCRRVPL